MKRDTRSPVLLEEQWPTTSSSAAAHSSGSPCETSTAEPPPARPKRPKTTSSPVEGSLLAEEAETGSGSAQSSPPLLPSGDQSDPAARLALSNLDPERGSRQDAEDIFNGEASNAVCQGDTVNIHIRQELSGEEGCKPCADGCTLPKDDQSLASKMEDNPRKGKAQVTDEGDSAHDFNRDLVDVKSELSRLSTLQGVVPSTASLSSPSRAQQDGRTKTIKPIEEPGGCQSFAMQPDTTLVVEAVEESGAAQPAAMEHDEDTTAVRPVDEPAEDQPLLKQENMGIAVEPKLGDCGLGQPVVDQEDGLAPSLCLDVDGLNRALCGNQAIVSQIGHGGGFGRDCKDGSEQAGGVANVVRGIETAETEAGGGRRPPRVIAPRGLGVPPGQAGGPAVVAGCHGEVEVTGNELAQAVPSRSKVMLGLNSPYANGVGVARCSPGSACAHPSDASIRSADPPGVEQGPCNTAFECGSLPQGSPTVEAHGSGGIASLVGASGNVRLDAGAGGKVVDDGFGDGAGRYHDSEAAPMSGGLVQHLASPAILENGVSPTGHQAAETLSLFPIGTQVALEDLPVQGGADGGLPQSNNTPSEMDVDPTVLSDDPAPLSDDPASSDAGGEAQGGASARRQGDSQVEGSDNTGPTSGPPEGTGTEAPASLETEEDARSRIEEDERLARELQRAFDEEAAREVQDAVQQDEEYAIQLQEREVEAVPHWRRPRPRPGVSAAESAAAAAAQIAARAAERSSARPAPPSSREAGENQQFQGAAGPGERLNRRPQSWRIRSNPSLAPEVAAREIAWLRQQTDGVAGAQAETAAGVARGLRGRHFSGTSSPGSSPDRDEELIALGRRRQALVSSSIALEDSMDEYREGGVSMDWEGQGGRHAEEDAENGVAAEVATEGVPVDDPWSRELEAGDFHDSDEEHMDSETLFRGDNMAGGRARTIPGERRSLRSGVFSAMRRAYARRQQREAEETSRQDQIRAEMDDPVLFRHLDAGSEEEGLPLPRAQVRAVGAGSLGQLAGGLTSARRPLRSSRPVGLSEGSGEGRGRYLFGTGRWGELRSESAEGVRWEFGRNGARARQDSAVELPTLPSRRAGVRSSATGEGFPGLDGGRPQNRDVANRTSRAPVDGLLDLDDSDSDGGNRAEEDTVMVVDNIGRDGPRDRRASESRSQSSQRTGEPDVEGGVRHVLPTGHGNALSDMRQAQQIWGDAFAEWRRADSEGQGRGSDNRGPPRAGGLPWPTAGQGRPAGDSMSPGSLRRRRVARRLTSAGTSNLHAGEGSESVEGSPALAFPPSGGATGDGIVDAPEAPATLEGLGVVSFESDGTCPVLFPTSSPSMAERASQPAGIARSRPQLLAADAAAASSAQPTGDDDRDSGGSDRHNEGGAANEAPPSTGPLHTQVAGTETDIEEEFSQEALPRAAATPDPESIPVDADAALEYPQHRSTSEIAADLQGIMDAAIGGSAQEMAPAAVQERGAVSRGVSTNQVSVMGAAFSARMERFEETMALRRMRREAEQQRQLLEHWEEVRGTPSLRGGRGTAARQAAAAAAAANERLAERLESEELTLRRHHELHAQRDAVQARVMQQLQTAHTILGSTLRRASSSAGRQPGGGAEEGADGARGRSEQGRRSALETARPQPAILAQRAPSRTMDDLTARLQEQIGRMQEQRHRVSAASAGIREETLRLNSLRRRLREIQGQRVALEAGEGQGRPGSNAGTAGEPRAEGRQQGELQGPAEWEGRRASIESLRRRVREIEGLQLGMDPGEGQGLPDSDDSDDSDEESPSEGAPQGAGQIHQGRFTRAILESIDRGTPLHLGRITRRSQERGGEDDGLEGGSPISYRYRAGPRMARGGARITLGSLHRIRPAVRSRPPAVLVGDAEHGRESTGALLGRNEGPIGTTSPGWPSVVSPSDDEFPEMVSLHVEERGDQVSIRMEGERGRWLAERLQGMLGEEGQASGEDHVEGRGVGRSGGAGAEAEGGAGSVTGGGSLGVGGSGRATVREGDTEEQVRSLRSLMEQRESRRHRLLSFSTASERLRQQGRVQWLQARGIPSMMELGMLPDALGAEPNEGRGRRFGGGIPLAFLLAHVDRDFNESDYEALLELDDDIPSHRGASGELINSLKSFTATEDKLATLDACVVCLEKPEVGASIRELPCSHSFHLQCIDEWLGRRAVCPICKRSIRE